MFRNAPIWLPALAAIAAAPASAAPLLSEVLYDAVGTDNGQVFVELWAPAGTSLDGLTIEGINGSGGAVTHTLTLSGVVPVDGFFVIGDDRGDGLSDVADVDLVLDFDFQNGPDSIVLRDAGGVLDALAYGSFGVGDVFAGEGTAAPDGAAGESLARVFANLDSDDNAVDFALLATPTPGSGPLTAVPEPGSLALCVAGLLGLALHGRRVHPA